VWSIRQQASGEQPGDAVEFGDIDEKLRPVQEVASSYAGATRRSGSPDAWQCVTARRGTRRTPRPGYPGDLILADFSRYLLGWRERLRAEVSIHVAYLSDQSCYRFVVRVAGSPIDRIPVIPANGSTATSPFVVLGARVA
jgi:hypothetical protein